MSALRIFITVVALPLAVLISSGHTQDEVPSPAKQSPEASVQGVMEAKVAHCRNLMRALSVEDYESLEKNATALAAIARLGAWQVDDSPEYAADSVDFERAAFMIVEAAKKKDVNDATVAYLKVAFSCFECHDRLRKAKGLSLAGVEVARVKSDAPPEKASVWMLRKLQWSQDLLASLVTEDFEALAEASDAMQGLSRVEGWVRGRDSNDYQTHLRIFDLACRQLKSSAVREDLAAAEVAFAQLMLSCANCHRAIRTD